MENPQRQYQPANNFFYKFYNYNLEDSAILPLIPQELYGYVMRELMFFKNNQHISRMDAMMFNSFLFNLVKLNFAAQHEILVNKIKEL